MNRIGKYTMRVLNVAAFAFWGMASTVFATDFDSYPNLNFWWSGTAIKTNLTSPTGAAVLRGGAAAISIARNDGAAFVSTDTYRVCLSATTACTEIASFSVIAGTMTSTPYNFLLPITYTTGARSLWVQRVDAVTGALDPTSKGGSYSLSAFQGTYPTGLSAKAVTVGSGRGGGATACALSSAGDVYCWGSNGESLGQGDGIRRPVPTLVAGLPKITKVVIADNGGACALANGGAVYCWGGGTSTPKMILASGAVDVATGPFAACAVLSTGNVQCWGDNSSGSLGLPKASVTSSTTPVTVTAIGAEAVAVYMGTNNACVETVSGAIKCWGTDGSGQAGDGRTTQGLQIFPASTPTGLTGFRLAESKADAWCAYLVGGGAKCWGYQWPLASFANRQVVSPTAFAGLAGNYSQLVTSPNGGGCAITTAGALKCWGFNSAGQVGDGTTVDRFSETSVVGLSAGVASVSAGGSSACAVLISGGIRCWGLGWLGDGTSAGSTVPVDVLGFGDAGALQAAPTVSAWNLSGDVVTVTATDPLAANSGIISRIRARCRNAENQYSAIDRNIDISEPTGKTHTWRFALPRDLANGVDGWECSVGYVSNLGPSGMTAFQRVGVPPIAAPTIISAVLDGGTGRIKYRDNNAVALGPIIARTVYCADGNTYVSPTELFEHAAGAESTMVITGLDHNAQSSNPWSCKVQVRSQGGRGDFSANTGFTSSLATPPAITWSRLVGNTGLLEFSDNQPATASIANALWQCTNQGNGGNSSGTVAINSSGGAIRRISFPLTSSNLLQNPSTYSCTVSLSSSNLIWGMASAAAIVQPNRAPTISALTFQVVNQQIVGSFSIQDADSDSVKNLRVHVGKTFPGNDCVGAPIGAAEALYGTGTKSFTIDNNELCTSMLTASGTIYGWVEAFDQFDAQAPITTASYAYTAPPPTYTPDPVTHQFVAEAMPTSLQVGQAVDIKVKLVDGAGNVLTGFRGAVRVSVDTFGLSWDMELPPSAAMASSAERVVWFQNGRGVIKAFKVNQPATVSIFLSANTSRLSALASSAGNDKGLKSGLVSSAAASTEGRLPPIEVSTKSTVSVQIVVDEVVPGVPAISALFGSVSNQQVNVRLRSLSSGTTFTAGVWNSCYAGPSCGGTHRFLEFRANAPRDWYRVEFAFAASGTVMDSPADMYIDASLAGGRFAFSGAQYLPFDRKGLRPVVVVHGVFGSSAYNGPTSVLPRVPPQLCAKSSFSGTGFNQFQCAKWAFYRPLGKRELGFGWAEMMDRLLLAGYAVVPVAYDFRLSPPDAASVYLAPAIDRARRVTRRADGTYPLVDIVAHSMGGVISAFYLAGTDSNVRNVDRLIAVGTPFGGSYNAVGLMQAGDPVGTDCAIDHAGVDVSDMCTKRQWSTLFGARSLLWLKQAVYTNIAYYLYEDMELGTLLGRLPKNGSDEFFYAESNQTERMANLSRAAPSGWYLYPKQLFESVAPVNTTALAPSSLRANSECTSTSSAARTVLGQGAKTRLIGIYSNNERTINKANTSLLQSASTFAAYAPYLSVGGTGDGTVPENLSRLGISRLFGTGLDAAIQPCVVEGAFGKHAAMFENGNTVNGVLAALAGSTPAAASVPLNQLKAAAAVTPTISVSTDSAGIAVSDPSNLVASWIDGAVVTQISGANLTGSASLSTVTVPSPATGRYVIRASPPPAGQMNTIRVGLVDSTGSALVKSLRLLKPLPDLFVDVLSAGLLQSVITVPGPAAPAMLAVAEGRGRITLLWTPSAGASGYEVFSRQAGSSLWQLIASSDASVAPYAVLAGYEMASETFPRLEFAVIARDSAGAYSPVETTTTNSASLNPQLHFGSLFGVTPSSVQSSTATAANANPLAFTIVGGQYSINGGAWATAAGVMNFGDQISVRLTAAGTDGTLSSVTLTTSTGLTFTFDVTTSVSCRLDVSGDSTFTTLDALLVARTMMQLTPDAVTSGLFTPALTSGQSATLTAKVQQMIDVGLLDLDGDGQTLATTDGVLLARIAKGVPITTAALNVINPNGKRNTWPLVRDFLNLNCGTSLQ